MSMLLFYAKEDCFAIDIQSILKVIPYADLNKASFQKKGVCGLLNYGGNYIPIIDFNLFLDKPPSEQFLSTRIILLINKEKENVFLGIIGENVFDLIDIKKEDLIGSSVKAAYPFIEKTFIFNQQTVQYLDVRSFFHLFEHDQ